MIRYRYAILILLILAACHTEISPLDKALSKGSAEFQKRLNDPKHEVQIIYGKIEADSIVHYAFNADERRYFYPASTIKMPVALAAIKRAEELGVSLDARLYIDSTAIYPRHMHYDSTFKSAYTLRQLISMIFSVSDNTASNLLYGWLGRDYIKALYQRGGLETRIVHQLGESAFSFSRISNRYTRKARIVDGGDTLLFTEQAQIDTAQHALAGQIKGKGFIDSLGVLVEEPFDFSQKNFVSLPSLLTILEQAIRPDLFKENLFSFSADNHTSLLASMRLLPRDLPPPYDTLPDQYVKFLMFGNEQGKEMPSTIHIKNKVGWAYGYLLDVAYIEDSQNDLSFFLAAVIHVNENAIYNDGIYEYETIGLPFLDELGDLIYAYERAHK